MELDLAHEWRDDNEHRRGVYEVWKTWCCGLFSEHDVLPCMCSMRDSATLESVQSHGNVCCTKEGLQEEKYKVVY
jgi:hypothetical protein